MNYTTIVVLGTRRSGPTHIIGAVREYFHLGSREYI